MRLTVYMDQQHPIPQDVTGFQFKLIGDMTIKQFVYLAAGVVLAWITISLPLYALIKYPLVLLFGGLGVCLAFVPIEGRPFDVMLMNFLKTLFAPNEYIFQKVGHPILPIMQIPKIVVQKPQEKEEEKIHAEDKLHKYLNTIHKTSSNALDERETRFLGALSLTPSSPQTIGGTAAQVTSATYVPSTSTKQQSGSGEMRTIAAQPIMIDQTQNLVAPQETQQIIAPSPNEQSNDVLEKEAAILQQELQQAREDESKAVQQSAPTTAVAHAKVIELEKELADILGQKDSLQKQLITLKKELAQQKQQVFSPSVGAVKQTTQNVRIIQQGQGKAAGLLAAPEAPNLLTGIIKDPRNNSLPNILVEVKDKDGNPVRAFKTNGLGQFAAATQLANGVYTITFEDPGGKNKFDAIEIPVMGTIISPLEIISIDEREQLRQELFKA